RHRRAHLACVVSPIRRSAPRDVPFEEGLTPAWSPDKLVVSRMGAQMHHPSCGKGPSKSSGLRLRLQQGSADAGRSALRTLTLERAEKNPLRRHPLNADAQTAAVIDKPYFPVRRQLRSYNLLCDRLSVDIYRTIILRLMARQGTRAARGWSRNVLAG